MTGAPVPRRFDAAVLGGGIMGMSCALHLQKRGLAVAVIDRDRPGRGASYGHAGLVERSSVIPYAFPRRLGELLRHAAAEGGHRLLANWLETCGLEGAVERAKGMAPLVTS